jgi:hypothetical protein
MKIINIVPLSFVALLNLNARADFKSYVFPSLEASVDPVTGKSRNVGLSKPGTFAADMETAVKTGRAIALTQETHGCNWAVTSQIYAFPEGAIYTEPTSSTYNIFPRVTVLKYGCWLPTAPDSSEFIYPVAPGAQVQISEGAAKSSDASLVVPNFVDLGYGVSLQDNLNASIEIPISDRTKFAKDMSLGAQLSQKQHGCPDFAKKPYIYVFNDAVVYARLDNASYSVFAKKFVQERGCKLPNMAYQAPRRALVPFNYEAAGFQRNPFISEVSANASSAGSRLDDAYANQYCGGKWSWETTRPYAATTISVTPVPGATYFESISLKPSSPIIDKKIAFSDFSKVVVTKLSPGGADRRVQTKDVLDAAKNLCLSSAIDTLPRIYAFDPRKKVTLKGTEELLINHLVKDEIQRGTVIKDNQAMQAKIDTIFGGPGYRYLPEFNQQNNLVVPTPDVYKQGNPSDSYRYYVLDSRPSSLYQKLRNPNGTYTLGEIEVSPVYVSVSAAEQSSGGTLKKFGDWVQGKSSDVLLSIHFSCNTIVKPRELSLSVKEKTNPTTSNVALSVNIESFKDKDFLKDSSGQPLLGKRKSEILGLAPLYRYVPSGALGDSLKGKEDQLVETRNEKSFTCSSGDHLAATIYKKDSPNEVDEELTRAAIIDKYNFLYASIKSYMLTHSLVDYVKAGYCTKLDASCTYDKSPEFAAMLRNFQALRFEKSKYLLRYNEGLAIETMEHFGDISKAVAYPEHVNYLN